jgi:uncharacterized protein YoxC
MLAIMQAAPVPEWVGPTMAISLVIIALAFIVIAAAVGLAVREAAREMKHLARVIDSLRVDLGPALGAAGLIGKEAEELVQASRQLRAGVRERVANLEAMYDVLEEEVEETAIEVAVTLRGLRTGAGWNGRLRRLLGGGRRR